jgi:tripartite-type tricarboxylate transporter receptor subunit TctC
LKFLAQSSIGRSASLPEVPTYEEAGIKGLVLEQWFGVFVAAGTPKEIVARLNAEIVQALADPAIRARYAQSGLEPVGGTPEEFAAVFRADYQKYRRLVTELKIRAD